MIVPQISGFLQNLHRFGDITLNVPAWIPQTVVLFKENCRIWGTSPNSEKSPNWCKNKCQVPHLEVQTNPYIEVDVQKNPDKYHIKLQLHLLEIYSALLIWESKWPDLWSKWPIFDLVFYSTKIPPCPCPLESTLPLTWPLE